MAEEPDTDRLAVWPASTADGQARNIALAALGSVDEQPTSLVAYESAGSVLLTGTRAQVADAAARLHGHAGGTAVITDLAPGEPCPDIAGFSAISGQVAHLTGHLGRFEGHLQTAKGGRLALAELATPTRPWFDLVLDFSNPALIDVQTPPFGYFAIATAADLDKALAEIPELTGEFEKPKFFNFDPAICAHSRSELTGCTRCLDSCSSGAITSLDHLIRIDPFLCQGVGVCATSCPTGAITYAYPVPRDLLLGVRRMLRDYRQNGGQRPLVLFHDTEQGAGLVREAMPALPESVLPVAVEDIGSVGMDAWFATLAFGAERVLLLTTPAAPRRVVQALDTQIGIARAVLAGMGYEPVAIDRLAAGDDHLPAALAGLEPLPVIQPAGFDTFNEKRRTVRLAVDHLYAQAPAPQLVTELTAGSPFGAVEVNREACTLCMGCVQVCPTRALMDTPDRPRLAFNEDLCVQCGLCETACPEDAITLHPRYLYDPEDRRENRVLNEEAPFECVSCGKPFATASVIARIQQSLSGHYMFQSDEQRRRLMMCGECRVKDMMRAELKQGRSLL